MTSAAIYARVSSARQKKDETIGSQTAALRVHAADNRLEVPEEWVFEDEGHSGATLVIGHSSFHVIIRDAGFALRDQYGVGRRQIRGPMAAEDEFRLDPPAIHLRGWFLRPPARNSSSACVTTAEIVRPDARAWSRTAAASRTGTLTVNTTVASGACTRPPAAAAST